MIAHDQKLASQSTRSDVRMDGVFFFRSTVGGTFSRNLDPGNFSYCVMVRSGRLRLALDFPAPMEIQLGRGDAVAVSGLTPHAFTSIVAPATGGSGPFEKQPLAGGKLRGDVELVIGVAPNEALALGSLMLGPILVRRSEHPDLARRLWQCVEMLEDEYADDSWIDRNLVIRRLAEIMLINMSRRVLANRDNVAGRGPSVSTNRQLMHAINAFFAAPNKAWTLPDLARVAGMSRTRFAEEFKLATGQTPARIISRMRLTAVARELTSAKLSVEAAAEEAGYSSSAAFVRAFQREFGETPARWRRQRLSDTQGPRRPAHGKGTRRVRARRGQSVNFVETKETP